jgi:hypothetical protein
LDPDYLLSPDADPEAILALAFAAADDDGFSTPPPERGEASSSSSRSRERWAARLSDDALVRRREQNRLRMQR